MKKAQATMIETFMVLVIFFILLMIGIYFYFQFSAKGIKKTGEELAKFSGTTLLSTITSMPELKCVILKKEENCLDAIKLSIASKQELLKKMNLSMLRGKSVYVYVVYPEEDWIEKKCEGNNIECGNWTLLKSRKKKGRISKLSTAVSIYYPTQEKYYVGKLIVEY